MRGWIRVVTVLVWIGLAAEQVDVMRRVGRGEMPQSELRDGFVLLGLVLVGAWLLAFRPRVCLDAAGRVEVRNPIRTHRFLAAEVIDIGPTGYGLRFQLVDGRSPRSSVFQNTRSLGEPRWFDVAEAVTGHRPVPPPEPDIDE